MSRTSHSLKICNSMSGGRLTNSSVFWFIEPDIGGGGCDLKEQSTHDKKMTDQKPLPRFCTKVAVRQPRWQAVSLSIEITTTPCITAAGTIQDNYRIRKVKKDTPLRETPLQETCTKPSGRQRSYIPSHPPSHLRS